MEGNEGEINFINFNQDCTSLAVGTRSGYKLFSLNSIEKLELIYASPCKDVTIVERLFSSSLLALVSQSSPRKLKVCHFKKGTEICQYSYSNTILAVKLNRARLVVCLEESLYIHNIRDMKILHTIRETPPNPRGLCALSINSDNCFLAYPGSSTTGEVQLFDAFNLQAKLMIPAHDSPLAAMAFNPAGNCLATASERGTVIRVFSVVDGSKLIEFRRGVKRCAMVYSLSFSQDSQFLALSSNTETIHIFKFDQDQDQQEQQQQQQQQQSQQTSEADKGWLGYLSKAVTASASYLPTQVTDTFNQSRAVATVSVPNSGANTVAIATVSRQPRLLLASSDGYLYIYNIPGADGGECVMVKQHRIDLGLEENLSHPDSTTSTSPIGVPILAPGKAVLATSPTSTTTMTTTTHLATSPTTAAAVAAAGDDDSPAVLPVTHQESHSPTFDDSPPPTYQRPEV